MDKDRSKEGRFKTAWNWFFRLEATTAFADVVYSKGWVATLITVLTTVLGGLAQWPWKVLVPLTVFGTALILVCALAWWWRRGGKPEAPPLRIPMQAIQDRRKAVALDTLLNFDRQHLPELIMISKVATDPNTLRYASPYIGFDFTITNASIYTIVQRSIRGRLVFNDQELGGEVEFQSDPHKISHGQVSHIAFRQWIGELAHYIDMNRRCPIGFHMIEIVCTASFEDIVEQQFRLALPPSFTIDA